MTSSLGIRIASPPASPHPRPLPPVPKDQLRSSVTKPTIPFRPRGFPPPRRFPPRAGRESVAPHNRPEVHRVSSASAPWWSMSTTLVCLRGFPAARIHPSKNSPRQQPYRVTTASCPLDVAARSARPQAAPGSRPVSWSRDSWEPRRPRPGSSTPTALHDHPAPADAGVNPVFAAPLERPERSACRPRLVRAATGGSEEPSVTARPTVRPKTAGRPGAVVPPPLEETASRHRGAPTPERSRPSAQVSRAPPERAARVACRARVAEPVPDDLTDAAAPARLQGGPHGSRRSTAGASLRAEALRVRSRPSVRRSDHQDALIVKPRSRRRGGNPHRQLREAEASLCRPGMRPGGPSPRGTPRCR